MTDAAAAPYRASIADAFPALAIHTIRFLAEGWDSTVWEVNGDLLFRFPKRAEVGMWLRREIAILPLLGPTLPVSIPQFAFIAETPRAFPYPFVGYRKLPGVSLDRAPAAILRPERLTAQIAAFLTALHRFPVAHAVRCGVPDASPEGWRAQFAAMWAKLQPRYPPMTVPERERADALFARYLDQPAHARFTPVLLHRDLSGEHLLLDPQTGDLVAIIDWGDLAIGDPAQDFAGFPPAWLPDLLARYGGAVDATFTDRAAFYRAIVPYYALLSGNEQ